MKPTVYILLCSDGRNYVGSTTHLEERLKAHFGEHPIYESGSKFTKAFTPIKLVYTEEYDRIDEAFKRERQIHGWSHAKKEALIKGDFDLLKKLSKSK